MLALTRLAAVVVLLVLSPAVPSQADVDCRGATPLPDGLELVAPAADVPESAARFAGAWSGAWRDAGGSEALCSTLVVVEVLANGYVRVVYSVGAASPLNEIPNFWRSTGRIVDGVLRFQLPTIGGGALAYRFDGAQLVGTYNNGGAARLARIADVSVTRCGFPARPRPAPPAPGPRDRLTASELMAPSFTGTGPVHNDYFTPIGAAGAAKHAIRGTLTVAVSSLAGENRGCAAMPRATPAFSVAFFTQGEHLVPAVRDFVPTAGTLLLSPGRVWSEPGDGGMSRASFPFALVNPMNNATLNGLATFLFDDTRVSALSVQVVQETVPWAKVDLWGQIAMTYAPGPVADEPALRAAFAEELRRQTPIRPWSALGATPALAAFDGDAAPADISANGLVVDGILYVRGCHTRYGPFPYCRDMRHGVFSVTKSAAGAVALLRLAQKYGDAVLGEKLVDYLPAGGAHASWSGVTFADALGMATGIGNEGRERDGSIYADENRSKMIRWVGQRKTAKEKLEGALDYGKYSWGPGEVLRYNSTQTFVLAAALDAYLKRREGPNAHLWDLVRNEVFRPIGIAHAPKMHTLEADGSRGVPLARLRPVSHGRRRCQARHAAPERRPSRRRAAPERAEGRGGPVPNEPRRRPAHWRAEPIRRSALSPLVLGDTLPDERRVLLPDPVHGRARRQPGGAVAERRLRVPVRGCRQLRSRRDGGGRRVDPSVLSAAGDRGGTRAGARPAHRERARRRDPGTYLHDRRPAPVLRRRGAAYGTASDARDLGTWTITPGGRVCRAWTVWDNGLSRCYAVFRDGETYTFDIPSGSVVSRRAGAPAVSSHESMSHPGSRNNVRAVARCHP